MGIDVKEITEAVSEGTTMVADFATGAAMSAADTATHPIKTLQRQARRLERKGAPVNKQVSREVNRDVNAAVDTSLEIVSGALPERIAIQGLRLIKANARRKDMVGVVAYSYLSILNTGLERFGKTIDKLEQASQPPADSRAKKPVRRASSTVRSTTRSTTRSASRSTRSAARSTRRSVRSGATRARKTEQKSA